MFGIVSLFSCAAPSLQEDTAQVPSDLSVVTPTEMCSVLVEELHSALLHSALPIGSHRHLLRTDDGLMYFDEGRGETALLFASESLDAQRAHFAGAALDSSQILLAAEGKIYTFDGSWLSLSPINDQLPVPISSIQSAGSVLWFFGADQLFRWQAGQRRQGDLD